MAFTKWEPAAAAAVIGISSYQLWSAWNQSAPSLAEARAAMPGDITIRQRLLDANLTVGSLAFIIGVAIAILTRDITALVLMAAIFGTLSMWHYAILSADPR